MNFILLLVTYSSVDSILELLVGFYLSPTIHVIDKSGYNCYQQHSSHNHNDDGCCEDSTRNTGSVLEIPGMSGIPVFLGTLSRLILCWAEVSVASLRLEHGKVTGTTEHSGCGDSAVSELLAGTTRKGAGAPCSPIGNCAVGRAKLA
eukprot:TRINITY_DN2303_c0_g1_i2.p1 TRINITY_DN2303_c0_g1~~TRINITY_DN2303_c0_g1_i2.p1  ORF type:complete len:147 (+),score=10.01 TRINITY_DN2303_c0_g1_i2:16-456(+)